MGWLLWQHLVKLGLKKKGSSSCFASISLQALKLEMLCNVAKLHNKGVESSSKAFWYDFLPLLIHTRKSDGKPLVSRDLEKTSHIGKRR